MFSNYKQVQTFLDDLGLFHMDLTLDRVKSALQELNIKKSDCYIVQIVGTNGKGSTATFLESIARKNGLKTGLFTSPHFVSPRERVLCNALPLSEDDWTKLACKVHKAAPNLTYFEFITVLAMLAFVENGVQLAIFEAGLGGSFDATTAINRNLLCISPISMDHEAVLGNNLQAIARDKSGAIALGMQVYCAPQHIEVIDILKDRARQEQANLTLLDDILLPNNTKLGLVGEHQYVNANLALSAARHILKYFNYEYSEGNTLLALENAFIAGRLQSIKTHEDSLPPQLLLDGAHNEQGLQVLIDAVEKMEQKPKFIIFSCMADKDIVVMRKKLLSLRKLCNNCPLILVGLHNNQRALSSYERSEFLQELGGDNELYNFENLSLALEFIATRHKVGPVLICGSLYLLGEFYEMYPHYLRPFAA